MSASPSGTGRRKAHRAGYAAAALAWLAIAVLATGLSLAKGGDIDNCLEGRKHAIDHDWFPPTYTCIYRHADGTTYSVSSHATPMIIAGIGLIVGMSGTAVLLWAGFRRSDA